MTLDVMGFCAFGVILRTQEVGQEGDAVALFQATRAMCQSGGPTFYSFLICASINQCEAEVQL